MVIDEINKKIIRVLRDGRKPFGDIAKKLGLTPNTVRGRVRKLIGKKAFDIVGVIDPDKMTGHFVTIVGIRFKILNLLKKAEEFSKLKGVISVSIVTGQFDFILTVLLNNEFGLLDFQTKELSKISDVISSETFVVYKNFNLRVPYVL